MENMGFVAYRGRIDWMKNSRFDLVGLVCLLLAVPLWILDGIEIYLRSGQQGNPRSYFAAPIVLCGITVAVHRLLRPHKNAWPYSALIAGFIVLIVLLWLAG